MQRQTAVVKLEAFIEECLQIVRKRQLLVCQGKSTDGREGRYVVEAELGSGTVGCFA